LILNQYPYAQDPCLKKIFDEVQCKLNFSKFKSNWLKHNFFLNSWLYYACWTVVSWRTIMFWIDMNVLYLNQSQNNFLDVRSFKYEHYRRLIVKIICQHRQHKNNKVPIDKERCSCNRNCRNYLWSTMESQ